MRKLESLKAMALHGPPKSHQPLEEEQKEPASRSKEQSICGRLKKWRQIEKWPEAADSCTPDMMLAFLRLQMYTERQTSSTLPATSSTTTDGS